MKQKHIDSIIKLIDVCKGLTKDELSDLMNLLHGEEETFTPDQMRSLPSKNTLVEVVQSNEFRPTNRKVNIYKLKDLDLKKHLINVTELDPEQLIKNETEMLKQLFGYNPKTIPAVAINTKEIERTYINGKGDNMCTINVKLKLKDTSTVTHALITYRKGKYGNYRSISEEINDETKVSDMKGLLARKVANCHSILDNTVTNVMPFEFNTIEVDKE